MDRAKLSVSGRNRELLFWVVLLGLLFWAQYGYLGLFGRSLIDHDDLRHIAPLEKISLGDYFLKWLPDRSNYGFPLQDLTYRIDFAIASALGVKTFWLTNLLLFLATLFSLDRITRLYFRGDSWIRLGILAAFTLHPVITEPLQWAYLRKILLVSALITPATFLVLRANAEARAPRRKEWYAIWGCYLTSLLCFPSGLLWIFWALWILRDKFAEKRDLQRSLIGALALSALFLAMNLSGNTGWGAALRSHPAFHFVILGIGRGTWNLLFPFWLAPYYSVESFFNLAGLALAAGLIALGWHWRKELAPTRPLLALAATLFFPQLYIVLTYSDFVWSDRYLFLPLPYLLLAGALVFARAPEKIRRKFSPLLALFTLAFLPSTMVYAPSWKGAFPLMGQCAQREASEKCLALAVESAFQLGGCPLAAPWTDLALEKAAGHDLRRYRQLSDILPFYLYLCTAENMELSPEEKRRKLMDFPQELRLTSLRGFANILIDLQIGDRTSAWDRARETFLEPEVGGQYLTPAVASLFHGQATALCQILRSRECETKLKAFAWGIRGTELIPWVFEAGFAATLIAARTAERKDESADTQASGN